MWRLQLRVCLWACVAVLSAMGVGKVVLVLSVDGGVPGVGASQELNQEDVDSSFVQSTSQFNGSLGLQTDQLMWFMQVSDLHLSIFKDPSRITNFLDFCRHTVPTISPSVVLASGDLTDAKSEDGMGSSQYEAEWNHYRDTLKEAGLYNSTLWLDVRGNHDNFNLPSLRSPDNLYASHSVQGRQHQRSYLASAQVSGLNVAFIAVDATLLPGPKRPFNFVGVLPPSEYRLLQRLARDAASSYNYTVWFGHYPTSCIIGPPHGGEGVRGVMSGGVVYLCGHLHSLGGLVPAMYTRQRTGLLELELEDWKDGRMYRMMALDHGQFSFVDVRHNTWPVILITNPRHALHHSAQPGPEKARRLTEQSTHVRVLVWSPAVITRVALAVDGSTKWTELRHIHGPLYAVEWLPKSYVDGLHTLRVLAADADGRERVVEQPFSMDGSQTGFRFWPRVFLMSNISAVFQFLFGCSVCICILMLCVFKYLHYTVAKSRRVNICRGGIFRVPLLRAWVRKLWLLSSVDKIFWPLVVYMLYLPIGPLMIGELLDDQYGVIFSWGTFVYSSFLPGSLTFAYGFGLVLLYIFPLMLVLAHCIDCRLRFLFLQRHPSLLQHVFKNLPMLVLLLGQAYLSYLMFLAYGWLSVLFGPIRSWSVVLGAVLWLQAERLPPHQLKKAAVLWYGDRVLKGSDAPTEGERDDGHKEEDDGSDVDTWLRKGDNSVQGNGTEEEKYREDNEDKQTKDDRGGGETSMDTTKKSYKLSNNRDHSYSVINRSSEGESNDSLNFNTEPIGPSDGSDLRNGFSLDSSIQEANIHSEPDRPTLSNSRL